MEVDDAPVVALAVDVGADVVLDAVWDGLWDPPPHPARSKEAPRAGTSVRLDLIAGAIVADRRGGIAPRRSPRVELEQPREVARGAVALLGPRAQALALPPAALR